MDSGRNPGSVLVATSQLSPLSQFTQQSLYSPNQVDNQIIYRDYAAAAAAAVYASSNQAAANAYLSPAHSKHVIGGGNVNQGNGGGGSIFASNNGANNGLSANQLMNIPMPPPAHHQSTSAHHSGSLAMNQVNSHGAAYSYSHGLAQPANPLPAHIQQTSVQHAYPQLHGATGAKLSGASAISAIQFSQSNYPQNYVGPIQPIAQAKAPQYSNLYQFFTD